jgi:hypothetical protein
LNELMMVLGYGLEQGESEAARPERQHEYDVTRQHRPPDPDAAEKRRR